MGKVLRWQRREKNVCHFLVLALTLEVSGLIFSDSCLSPSKPDSDPPRALLVSQARLSPRKPGAEIEVAVTAEAPAADRPTVDEDGGTSGLFRACSVRVVSGENPLLVMPLLGGDPAAFACWYMYK